MQRTVFLIYALLIVLGIKAQPNLELDTAPVITSLSVDPASPITNPSIILKWEEAPAGQIIDYYDISEISYYTGINLNFKNPISVPGTQHSIIRTPGGTTDSRWSYRLQARNSEQKSPNTPAFVIMNIYGNYNYCGNTITLSWHPYQMLPVNSQGFVIIGKTREDTLAWEKAEAFNDAIRYQVWGYHGEGPFDINLAGPLTEKSEQNIDLLIENVEMNTSYFLFAKAYLPNGDSATSARLDIPTASKRLPNSMEIDSVINREGNILLHLNLDRTTEVDTFAIYRSNDYRPLQWYYNVNEVPTVFKDSRGISLGEVYSYRLVAFRCGRPVLESDSANNILLFSRAEGQNVQVRWSMVNGDDPSYILKRLDRNNEVDVSNHNFVFMDEGADYLCGGSHDFCYRIQADNGTTVSVSEVSCTSLFPIVNIPNAIDPSASEVVSSVHLQCTGQSGFSRNMFGPIIDMNSNAYGAILEIFDRSGTRLFSSKKDYQDAQLQFWDGSHNGRFVDEGVYVYSIRVAMDNKEPLTFRGTVSVVYSR